MRQRGIALLIVGALLMTISGCTNGSAPAATPTETSGAGRYQPGSYTGTATGRNGGVTVEVTFSEQAIEDVRVVSHSETEGIADGALEKIPQAIVDRQSLAVDAIAGATITSQAILEAAAAAAELAGGDVDALRKKPEADADVKVEETSCDIVVVGAGAAGSAAALAAAESGADVLLLEKTASPMGAGTLAGGLFAADSQQQKDRGEVVEKEWLYHQYIDLAGGYANSLLVREIIDASGTTVDWLNENGCVVSLVDAGTGGSYEHIGMPATLHGYQEGGTVAITKLVESFRDKGGTALFSTPATGLLYGEDGSIAGVTAKREDGSLLNIKAKAVIIATGGFGGDPEMMAQYIGEPFTLGEVAQCTGDGIRMAWEAGAAREGAGVAQYFWQTFTADEIASMAEIVGEDWWGVADFSKYPNLRVNLDGKRFSDETNATLYAIHGAQLHMQPMETEFVIVDSAMLEAIREGGTAAIEEQYAKWKDAPQFFMEFNEPNDTAEFSAWENMPTDYAALLDAVSGTGAVFRGDTLEELATEMGVDRDSFVASVQLYNNAAESGRDELFFADTSRLLPVEQGPFYAVKFVARNLGTLGGVRINEKIQAVDAAGHVIPGLYVAGADAGGMYGKSYVDFEGGTLGFAYISGRLAGQNAAEEVLR